MTETQNEIPTPDRQPLGFRVKPLVRFLLPRVFWRGNIMPGQKYIFDDNDRKNPFVKKPHIVLVTAVKNGFVLYDFINVDRKDETLKESTFNYCYRLYSET